MLDTNSTPTPLTTPPDEAEQPIAPPGKKRWFARHRFALGGILVNAMIMNFYALGKNGFGSYYPAAIRSMLDSWHNFFFVAYDPGGFVSIDKPPVGFWLEAASAKIFGFNSVSILLPQALAGVLSVWLLYYLVRRHFGVIAGLLAALALALTPISILTNRNVTIDSTLTLVLLLGAWTVLKAAETGRLRWLLLTALIVGIGFNIKTLEAYLVVPAYGLLYLLAAPQRLRKRIGHLALAGVLLLAISLSWVVAVDLTPAWQRRPRWPSDRQQQSLLLWGMWLLSMGIFFSVATFFHQYYFTVMAPAIAALFGIGVVTMWQDYRRGGWRGWLLPLALVATVAEQVYILSQYPTRGQWLIPLVVLLGGIDVGALIIARIAPRLHLTAPGRRVLVPALTAGVLVLMLAPTAWAAIPILTSTQADTLVAGPTQTTSFGGNVGGAQNATASSDTALIRYLEADQGTAKYLVAVSSSREADAIILATNKPVMTLGGFSGSDPILTTSQLAALVESGQRSEEHTSELQSHSD